MKVKDGAGGDVHSAGVDPGAGHDHRLVVPAVRITVFLLAFPDVMVYLDGLFRQKP